MYLTYQEYKEMGGSLSETAYPRFERKAEYHMDYWTLDRIKKLEEIPECVKDAMYEVIEGLPSLDGERVTSFSNGVNSFSFDTSTSEIDSLYQKVKVMLPVELISAVVSYEG